MIRVLVVNKRSHFITSIRRIFPTPGIEYLEVCEDPFKAIQLCASLKPSIVLVDFGFDIKLHGISSVELIYQLQNCVHAPRIIVVTTFYEKQLLAFLISNNIQGYFYRNSVNAHSSLVTCIRKVSEGEVYYME